MLAGLSGFTHPSVRHYPDKKIYIFMDRRDPREGAGRKAEWARVRFRKVWMMTSMSGSRTDGVPPMNGSFKLQF
jgi:hypothetical protein